MDARWTPGSLVILDACHAGHGLDDVVDEERVGEGTNDVPGGRAVYDAVVDAAAAIVDAAISTVEQGVAAGRSLAASILLTT